MTSFLPAVLDTWPHNWHEDPRVQDPIFVVNWGDQQYGCYNISIFYWVELLSMALLNASLAAVTGFVLYEAVVRDQPKQAKHQRQVKMTPTFSQNLLVYGLLIPFWAVAPYAMVRGLPIKHKIFRFVIGVISPILSLLRITEALYGFTPSYATTDAMAFTIYFASPLLFAHSKKTGDFIPISTIQILQHAFKFGGLLLFLGLYSSWLTAYPDLTVIGPIPSDWFALSQLFSPTQWINNLLHAFLLQTYLQTYCEGFMLAFSILSGKQLLPVMLNPVFESQSPSEFWGRRWNLLVHNGLKGGVYKPVAASFGQFPAMIAAFCYSGIFHEWLLISLFTSLPDEPEITICYGSAMIFFLWNAGLVGLELAFGKHPRIKSITQRLPRPVKTILILLAGVPFAHYFTHPYIHSDFFEHGNFAFPMIRKL